MFKPDRIIRINKSAIHPFNYMQYKWNNPQKRSYNYRERSNNLLYLVSMIEWRHCDVIEGAFDRPGEEMTNLGDSLSLWSCHGATG